MRAQRIISAAWFVVILVLSAGVAVVLTRPPLPLAAAEHLIQGVAFRILGPQRPAAVIIAGVTENTLSAFPYRSPIDRGFLAKLIETLAQSGVSAIGLDVILDRPTEPAKDEALRQALLQTPIPVVVITVGPDTALPENARRFLEHFLDGVRTGYANLARDRFDDTVRTHFPLDAAGQDSFPAAVARALGAPVPDQPFPIEFRRGVRGWRDGGDIPFYPAEAIGLLPPGWLKGKAVLIGSMIPGSDEHRSVASTFGRPSFGVEIHAQVLAQLLDRRAIPAPSVPWRDIAAASALAVLGVTAGGLWSGAVAVAAIAAVALVYISAMLWGYAATGELLPVMAPVTALLLAAGFIRAVRSQAERRDRRALRALFSRFISKDVVDQIMADRDVFMAGGRPRPMQLTATVLYADVAGFTTICETMEPEPLIAWLDGYIDTMSALIAAHGGVLLRFIGDGILAVFGVPVPRVNDAGITADAMNAARCAVAMEQAMNALNDARAAQGQPVAGLRIGVHTGPMVAGSLGTGARMEFCLLGDTANTGARLEQLGKDYAEPGPCSCTIVVGEPTWTRLSGTFAGIRIGDVVLRGRSAVMGAYRIDAAAARLAAASRPEAGSIIDLPPPVRSAQPRR